MLSLMDLLMAVARKGLAARRNRILRVASLCVPFLILGQL
jgi:hypothetical protein